MPDLKDAISSPFSILAKGAINLIDQFVEDKDANKRAKHELKVLEAKAETEIMLAQIKVNEQEARSPSVFVAGWRPAVGWLCIMVILYTLMLRDLLVVAVSLWAPEHAALIPEAPTDLTDIFLLLGSLLGVTITRSFEKFKGVARDRIL